MSNPAFLRVTRADASKRAPIIPINKVRKMSFVIEKNVPFHKSIRNQRYPFREMEIGDSFLVTIAESKNAVSAAYAHGYTNKKRFTARKENDGVRIWRVE